MKIPQFLLRGAMLAAFVTISESSLFGAAIILHQFTGSTTDGSSPQGSLAVSGSGLIGMTQLGGSANTGSVFAINLDGSGYTQLHSFVGGASDGLRPYGSLLVSGSITYGMTANGGSATGGQGTLFKMNTNGTGFGLLHSFAGTSADGGIPLGVPWLAGSTLYGTTQQGGSAGDGTVFKVNTDGSGFGLVHTFTSSDGYFPNGSLAANGGTFYGTTNQGPGGGDGAIFKMNTDGSGYSLIHSFSFNHTEGTNPHGSLTLANGMLYGTATQYGSGIGVSGTIFRLNLDGSGFQVLHSFTGSGNGTTGNLNDGREPEGSLTVVGTTLFGTTRQGGASANGTVFQMNLDGTGFQLLHSFSGTSDGRYPLGDVTYTNGNLYGMTSEGGTSNKGTVFAVATPEPSAASLMLCAGSAAFIGRRRRQCDAGNSGKF